MNILTNIIPENVKGFVGLDIEMFGQDEKRLHRPHGDFACISVAPYGSEEVYQITKTDMLVDLFDALAMATPCYHNATYDLRQLRRWVDIPNQFIWDTMLVERNLFSGYFGGFSLADLSLRWLSEPMDKTVRKEFDKATSMDLAMRNYAAKDAVNTVNIAMLQKQYIDTHPERNLASYFEVDAPMIWAVLDMPPVRVDVEGWLALAEEHKRLADEAEAKLGFNPRSPSQVIDNLFAVSGKRLKSSDAKSREELRQELEGRNKPDAIEMLDLIDTAKLYGTAVSKYGKNWITQHSEGGYVNSSWQISEAKTGRMCVHEDTMIETAMGRIAIRDLDLYVAQQCVTISHEMRWQPILRKFYKGEELMYRVLLENGNEIKGTREHKLLTDGGWKSIGSLEVGSIVLSAKDPIAGGHNSWPILDPRREELCYVGVDMASDREGDYSAVQYKSSRSGHLKSLLSFKVRKGNGRSQERKQPQSCASKGSVCVCGPEGRKNTEGRFGEAHQRGENGMGHIERAGCGCSNCSQEPKKAQYQSSTSQATTNETRGLGTNGAVGGVVSRFGRFCSKIWRRPTSIFPEIVCSICSANANDLVRDQVFQEVQLFQGAEQDTQRSYMLEQKQTRVDVIDKPTVTWNSPHKAIQFLREVYGRLFLSGKESDCGGERVHSFDPSSRGDKLSGVSPVECYSSRSGEGSGQDRFIHYVKVQSIEPIGEHGVWDIEVAEDHSYMAHGMWHHNSSSAPNLQNVPARTLPIFREMFIARPGHVLIVGDVSQQEPRILAYVSKDATLNDAINNREDLHLRVAREVYNVPDMTKDNPKRKDGKAINLGMGYGLTAYGLARNTNKPLEECEVIIGHYFQQFPGVKFYIDGYRRSALKNGWVETPFGRRSYINPHAREWENNAINSPIQGGAADQTKLAVLYIYKYCRDTNAPYCVVLVVHDEIVLDVPEEQEGLWTEVLKEAWAWAGEKVIPGIPMVTDIGVGKTWRSKA